MVLLRVSAVVSDMANNNMTEDSDDMDIDSDYYNFDPFLYLSVPIPGGSDRQIKVVYVPLDPDQRPQKLTIMVPKTGAISDLLEKCRERVVGLGTDPADLAVENMIAVDVWNNEIYAWHENKNDVDDNKCSCDGSNGCQSSIVGIGMGGIQG